MNTITATSRVENVRALSRAFRMACRVFLGLGAVLFGLGLGSLVSQGLGLSSQPGVNVGGVRMGGGDLSQLVTTGYWLFGIWVLERLFNVFATGDLLDERAGKWMKLFGFWVATSLLLPVLLRLVREVVATGQFTTALGEPAGHLGSRFLVGVFLVMLGWVLEEAGALKAEQELTV